MKNCKECGQALPGQKAQARDIVQILPLAAGLLPRLGMVLEATIDAACSARYGTPMKDHLRVMVLTGPLTGLTSQYRVGRLQVVKGHFHITERL